MGLALRYHPDILRDLGKIGTSDKLRIKSAIEKKLRSYPDIYGEPLRGTLSPLWKLRVGNYRIVYGIENQIVYIHAIAHRGDVYDHVAINRKRL